MRNLVASTAAIALMSGAAAAGGLDRSNQNMMFLYGEPGQATVSIGTVMPSITGTDDATGTKYDVGDNYTQIGASTVYDFGSGLSLGLQFDQPFGAAVSYEGTPTSDRLAGTKADISSNSLNAIGKYQLNENFSVFGGLRLQQAKGAISLNGLGYSIAIPANAVAANFNGLTAGTLGAAVATAGVVQAVTAAGGTPTAAQTGAATATANAVGAELLAGGTAAAAVSATTTAAITNAGNLTTSFQSTGGYNVDIKESWGLGYTFGAAYEIPEIALRASLSYHSSVEHKGGTTENLFGSQTTGTTTFETPSSINFDFQTGVAAGTLLTASARFAEWGSFDVVPPTFGQDLASIGDSKRYTLGLGRQLSDEIAMSVTLSHEPKGSSNNVSPLAPSNGLTGITIGGRYATESLTISGGINYTEVGDANAEVGGNGVATFTDNSVMGVGLQVSFEF